MVRSLKSPRILIAVTGLAAGAAVGFAGFGMAPASAGSDAAAGFAATFEAPANVRSFADVVEQVSPAVVNIAITKRAQTVPAGVFSSVPRGPGGSDLDEFFERFFPVPGMPGAPRQGPPVRGQGSGFIIDQGGYVVTNNHVVDGAESVVVTLNDGRELDATIVGTDPQTDLALLKIEAKDELPALRFGNSDEARVGDWVLAIGNPFGLGGTATAGIISARGRDIQSGPYDDYLQIDAPINSGNSGGPVFNANGEVIGVNTAIFSPNGGNVGIGFAIPASQVQTVVDELKESGTVERGWLGVQIQDVDDDLAASFGLDEARGVAVAAVEDDSPAERAGIQVGDVILKFAGEDIDSARKLSRTVAATDPQEHVRVTVWRDGKEKTLRVTLGQYAATGPTAGTPGGTIDPAAAELGLGLADLDDRWRERLGLPEDVDGVVVTEVLPGSPAADSGLRPGDVVSRIDESAVRSIEDAARLTAQASKRREHVTLLVRRGDAQRFVSVALS